MMEGRLIERKAIADQFLRHIYCMVWSVSPAVA
jgi:hypothetical protein